MSDPAPPPSPPLLEMSGIDKAFGGVAALRQARLSVGPGEVHALIGQNGAGKSTLIKILTGACSADAGSIRFAGREVEYRRPIEAQRAGISTIYQELNLVPQRSVAENIFIGREPRRFGLIDWRRVRREATELLEGLGIDAPVGRELGECNTATQQMTAIARAVSTKARLVIMDEPTSSLDESEVQTLFGVIRRLQADGIAVVFVSHRLDELYAVCERITVMRDGATVAERRLADFDKFQLVSTMLGKELSALQATRRQRHAVEAEEVLRADDLRAGQRVRGASLGIARGEVLGLGGLLGSGRTEFARLVFGADPVESGSLHFRGAPVRWRSLADAIRRGIAYLSEDRKVEGLIPDLSIRENLTLVLLPRLARLGIVDRTRQREVTERFIERLGIRCAGPEQPIRQLSGGNQQKVLLARWLATEVSLLLLDEPTRGIDVGAKAEILSRVRELARDQGLAVLMIASEIEELVGASDRVVVLRDGRTVADIDGEALTEVNVMHAMAHGAPPPAVVDAAGALHG